MVCDFQPHALAYNLSSFQRTLAAHEPIKDWSQASVKEKLIKIGMKVVGHGCYIAFQVVEVCRTEDAVRRDPAAGRRTAATA
jgi:hypothetical protein